MVVGSFRREVSCFLFILFGFPCLPIFSPILLLLIFSQNRSLLDSHSSEISPIFFSLSQTQKFILFRLLRVVEFVGVDFFLGYDFWFWEWSALSSLRGFLLFRS